MNKVNRRRFMQSFLLTSLSASSTTVLGSHFTSNMPDTDISISSQQYPWMTWLRRQNSTWKKDLGKSVEKISYAGFKHFEPIIDTPAELLKLAKLLATHGVSMPTVYVNSVLHDKTVVEKNIQNVLDIAKIAQTLGTKIITTNPSPIRWGGYEDKSDEQLHIQARALNRLGKALKVQDIQLAYHNHDAEMRNAGREFHHMMQATDASYVHLCLDAHWIYRGAGNSSIALFDIIKMYLSRINTLHLRQSVNGIWTESFGPGDIDHMRIKKMLDAGKIRPHLVLEQAIEEQTVITTTPLEAHRKSLEYAKSIFTR